jgi:predicted glycosyltransferase
VAAIIIKSEERKQEEQQILNSFGGGYSGNTSAQNREYAEEINARMTEIKRKVGMI